MEKIEKEALSRGKDLQKEQYILQTSETVWNELLGKTKAVFLQHESTHAHSSQGKVHSNCVK
jgi:hypothetical protein